MPAPTDFLRARLDRVREAMRADALDALLVTHLPNVCYLTNFTGSAAMLLVAADAVHLITDFRYRAFAEALLASPAGCPGGVLVPFDRTFDDTLLGLLTRLDVARVGFEAAWLPVARWLWLQRALGLEPAGPPGAAQPDGTGRRLVATERLVERARLRKDAYEIGVFHQAGGLISSLTDQILEEIRPGRTERDAAALVDLILVQGGFERTAFETIVASGPNAALPHARPGRRVLAPGDLIVLDFGGVQDGYCVDLTRTVSIGPPDAEARRVHEAVRQAQAAAIAAIRPGVPTDAPDRAARGVLAGCGLLELFGHGTGHGLGVEIHEEPRLAPARAGSGAQVSPPTDLETGMVITVEPGVYRLGWGGVRIEDDVVVTAGGCELLTTYDRGLLVR